MGKTVTSNNDSKVQTALLNIKTLSANLYTGATGGTITTDGQIYSNLESIEQWLLIAKGYLQAHANN